MKKLLIVLLALVMVLSLAACNNNTVQPNSSQPSDDNTPVEDTTTQTPTDDGEVYTLRIGWATANDSQSHYAELFKEQVEERAGGRIKIELYPGSQLGTNQTVVDSVQQGTIEASFQPTAFLGGFETKFNVGDLPFLWPDQRVMLEILNDTEIGREFADIGLNKNVKIVGFVNQGTKQIVANFPVNKMVDLKGAKFRIMGAPILETMCQDWGASATPLAYSEIYTALEQKTVDAIEQTMELTYKSRYYEAASYIMLTNHGLLPEVIMINLDWYNNLPSDLQEILDNVGHKVWRDGVDWNEAEEAYGLAEMEKAGITIVRLDDVTLQPFKDAAQKTYAAYIEKNLGIEYILEGFQAEIESRK